VFSPGFGQGSTTSGTTLRVGCAPGAPTSAPRIRSSKNGGNLPMARPSGARHDQRRPNWADNTGWHLLSCVRYASFQVMSASVKPRLAGRQPSNRGGVPRVIDQVE